MSPNTPLFGRLTLGNNRISLGRESTSELLMRAAEQIRQNRIGDDTVIQIELCRNKLPDASTFNRITLLEQELAAKIITDAKADSPFPGISVGRVVEVMGTKEYEAYESICKPDNRIGLTEVDIIEIKVAYQTVAPDCFTHFPQWVD